MKRILLPTDFSKNAWHAIQYALYLFERVPCKFYILHAHQVSPSGLISTINKERDTRLFEITAEEATRKLKKIVDRLIRINKIPGHEFEGIMEHDVLLNAIGRNIIDKDVDYLFMGTQGASGLKEVFLGSNTVNVIKHIHHCPVMAVPNTFEYGRQKKILFATDYRHLFQRAELEPLIAIAEITGSTIHVVHINEEEKMDKEQEQLKALLKGFLKKVDHQFEDLDYHPTLSARLTKWAEDSHTGIIAMINSRHGFFSRLVREPVVKKIAFRTHVPFLVLPVIQ